MRRALRVRSARRRGAALILVVVVIAALLAIAAPFVISMRLHEKSSRGFRAEVQAGQLADAGRSQAVAWLMETHPDEERRAREAQGDQGSDPEGEDTFDELMGFEPLSVSGTSTLAVDDPRGTMVHVEVRDEQGKLDPNTCGADALANLLGVTVTTETLSYEEEDRLQVEDVSPFFSDGDPETVDGFVRVGSELIAYRHIDRGPVELSPSGLATHPGALRGLVRGYLFSRVPPPEDSDARRDFHPAGTLVQDGRGFKLAAHPLWRYVGTAREGKLARFEAPSAVRSVAEWEYGTLRAALVLFRYGVTLDRLRQWGLTGEDVQSAGLDPSEYDDEPPAGEDAAAREARRAAERDLQRWGLDPDTVRRFGGQRAVLRLHAFLAGLDGERREQVIARYAQRQEQVEQQRAQVDDWLRDELRRQLRGLSEVRNQSPHLETIGRIELEEKLRPNLSCSSLPQGEAWSDPQVVNHDLRFEPYGWVTRLTIQDPRRFRSGGVVVVRPRDRALPPELRLCVGVNRDTVLLFPQLERDYEDSTVEVSCRQPRPINVNAASREVLRATLTGVQSRTGQATNATGGQAPNVVTPTQAAALAEAIVTREGGLTGPSDLRDLLLDLRGQGHIDDHDVDAVLRNAVDPADPMLTRATVPFCYTSQDVYEVASTGIVNDPAGNELARRAFREVVQVAPPRELTWHVDSQLAFSDRLYVGGNPTQRTGQAVRDETGYLYLPGRWSSLVQIGPQPLGPYGAVPFTWPARSHAPGQALLHPLLAHEPDPGRSQNGAAGSLRLSRWDDQMDGRELAGLTLPASELGTRELLLESGRTRAVLGPGSVRGWFRLDRLPASAEEKAFLLDGGQADNVDRVSLYLQGDRTLVLAVKGEALDLREPAAWGGTPRPTSIVYDRPTPFQAGNWYHVAAFWRGADRGDLALALDGRFVGRETLGGRLAQALDAFSPRIVLEDASAFPPSGWVRIGATRYAPQQGQQGAGATGGVPDRGLKGTEADVSEDVEVLHYSRKEGDTLVVNEQHTLVSWLAAQPDVSQLQIHDLSANRPLQQVPPRGRRPQRGSGHTVRYRYSQPDAQGNPQQHTRTEQLGYPHEAGTIVVPYGYHARVKNEGAGGGNAGFQDVVRRGQASLQVPLPQNAPFTVVYEPVPNYTLLAEQAPNFDRYPEVVGAGEPRIPVLWAAPYPHQPMILQGVPLAPGETDADRPMNVLGGFPPRGVVRICSNHVSPTGVAYQSVELVYYRRIVKLGTQYFLDGCERGLAGTAPAAHVLFATVTLESIELDRAPADYPPRAAFSEPRVYVSLSRPNPADPVNDTVEWLSILGLDDVSRRRCDGANLLLTPARESLEGQGVSFQVPGGPTLTMGAPGQVDFRYRDHLRRQLLQLSGTFPDPDQALLNQPDPALPLALRGQPWREVLKREQPSRAGPVRIQLGGRTQTVPFFQRGARSVKGTQAPSDGWAAGTRVVPTFAVRLEDARPANANALFQGILSAAECGPGDVVTLVDDRAGAVPPREEVRLVHAAPSLSVAAVQPGPMAAIVQQAAAMFGLVGDAGTGWLVATDDFVQREYTGAADARLARWPVGNLHSVPDLVLGRARPPSGPDDVVADAPGVLEGRVDDLVSMQLTEDVFTVGTLGAAEEQTVLGRHGDDWWKRGHLLRADGEVLAVVDAVDAPVQGGGNNVQGTLRRGALDSPAAPISAETALWRLTWPPVAVATGGWGGGRNQWIPVRQPMTDVVFRGQDDRRPHGGYLRVDGGLSVLPYRAFRGRRGAFERPLDRFGRGSYVAAFGIDPHGQAGAAPAANALLVEMPFRFHDRYQDGVTNGSTGSSEDDIATAMVDSLDGVFFQASRELPGAFVDRIEWDETLPSPHAEVKVAVRLDGDPSWASLPAKVGEPGERGRLWLFDDPRGDNRIQVRADRVEVRVYLTFKEGAFQADAWKDAAKVRALRVVYRQPTRVLRREERVE